MTHFLKIILFYCFLFSALVLNAQQTTSEPSKYPGVQIVEPSEQVVRDSSEHNRMDKQYSINVIATGLGPNYGGNTTGLSFGYFLDRNQVIDLEFVNARNMRDLYFYSDYDVRANSVGLHLKHFTSNSFYFRIGVDYRAVEYKYTYRDYSGGTVITQNEFKGNSIAATFLIGNQWQWKNFTLGCDWVGIVLPLTSQIKSESSTGSIPDPSYLNTEENRYVKDSTGIALRFYLGASF